MMSVNLNEIPIRWDEEDPTRFIVSFQNVDVNLDAGIARKLATALLTMAERADERVNRALRQIEGQR
jgi:hypothetical protein